LLLAPSSVQAVGKGLETIAGEGESSRKEEAPISESEFNRLMNYDTVDDVLAEYNIEPVDDNSYDEKVFGSDKHVMVLFYGNKSDESKSLAILTGLLSQKFGEHFDVYAYKAVEGETIYRSQFEKLKAKHGTKDIPTLNIYRNTGDKIQHEDNVFKIESSHASLGRLLPRIERHLEKNY